MWSVASALRGERMRTLMYCTMILLIFFLTSGLHKSDHIDLNAGPHNIYYIVFLSSYLVTYVCLFLLCDK